LVVFLLLIGVGIALGFVVAGIAAVAIGCGVISTSVAFGVLRRRPSSGFRFFFYQVFGLGFSCAGVLFTWLISLFFELHLTPPHLLFIGLASGISVGLLFGMLHSWIIDLVTRFLSRCFPPFSFAVPGMNCGAVRCR